MAIFEPAELDFGNDKFSIILYGDPGTGKTTLAASAPNPVLFDLDNGIRRIKAQHRPVTSRVNTYEELLEDLKSDVVAKCETVIIDTGGALITLLQDYVMRQDPVNRTKSGTISQKGFGAVKAEFIRLTNWLKTTLNKNIVYVFHAVEEKNKEGTAVKRLMCEGSAKNIVWQPCDFGCYLYKNGNQTVAGFSPTDEYFAKGCYGVSGVLDVPFGDNVINDFLTRLFDQANRTLAQDREFFAEEREKYEAAMAEGRNLIEAIATPEAATKFANKDVKEIKHCLTSLAELRQIFKDKTKELGYVWDSAAKCYKAESKEKPQNKPVKAKESNTAQESKEDSVEADNPETAPKTASQNEIVRESVQESLLPESEGGNQ